MIVITTGAPFSAQQRKIRLSALPFEDAVTRDHVESILTSASVDQGGMNSRVLTMTFNDKRLAAPAVYVVTFDIHSARSN